MKVWRQMALQDIVDYVSSKSLHTALKELELSKPTYDKIKFLSERGEIQLIQERLFATSTVAREFQAINKSEKAVKQDFLGKDTFSAKERECIGELTPYVARLTKWGRDDIKLFLSNYGKKNCQERSILKAIESHRKLMECEHKNNYVVLFSIYSLFNLENVGREMLGQPKLKIIPPKLQAKWLRSIS